MNELLRIILWFKGEKSIHSVLLRFYYTTNLFRVFEVPNADLFEWAHSIILVLYSGVYRHQYYSGSLSSPHTSTWNLITLNWFRNCLGYPIESLDWYLSKIVSLSDILNMIFLCSIIYILYNYCLRLRDSINSDLINTI